MSGKKALHHRVRWYSMGILVSVLFLAGGCVNEEGEGGTSSISGTLVTQYFNDDYSMMIKEEPAVDEKVSILYGDESFVGDDVDASNDGSFRFSWLRRGDYTVYYESEDTLTAEREEQVISHQVSIDKGEQHDMGKLIRFETLDFDDGSGVIKGVVKVINYKNSSSWPNLEVKDITYAQEQEVYLVYGKHLYYDERIRTGYDGYFEFRNLIPGDYMVYVYSEDVTGGTQDIEETRQATIEEEGDIVDVGEMMIEQL